jgi:phage terminase large subunit GpA-like protein
MPKSSRPTDAPAKPRRKPGRPRKVRPEDKQAEALHQAVTATEPAVLADAAGLPEPPRVDDLDLIVTAADSVSNAEISVATLGELEQMLGAAQAEQVAAEARRAAMMEKVAFYRWQIARYFHQMQSGEPMDFEKYRFQPDIYQCDSPHLVVSGSVQWGKTEFLICTAVAMTLCGLGVFYVVDKYDKRDRFVKSRVDPVLRNVPLYRQALEVAKERNSTADSTRFKFLARGFINFVGSNSPGDFSSYPADVAIVDEHQLCELDNVNKIDFRMKGSDWRFKVIVGNPRGKGTQDNQNLDWEYRQTDQRRWHIPCDECHTMQVLRWWTHFVEEVHNDNGGIISVNWRDKRWSPSSYPLDMRPICTACGAPMNRLHPEGEWRATNPAAPPNRVGFQLSNLYNPRPRMDELFEQYSKAIHNPTRLTDFINDELGEAHSLEGMSISDQMIQSTSTGRISGLEPYRLVQVEQIAWPTMAA